MDLDFSGDSVNKVKNKVCMLDGDIDFGGKQRREQGVLGGMQVFEL